MHTKQPETFRLCIVISSCFNYHVQKKTSGIIHNLWLLWRPVKYRNRILGAIFAYEHGVRKVTIYSLLESNEKLTRKNIHNNK
jgi:hypothetical protein